jgi:hypothetical protein
VQEFIHPVTLKTGGVAAGAVVSHVPGGGVEFIENVFSFVFVQPGTVCLVRLLCCVYVVNHIVSVFRKRFQKTENVLIFQKTISFFSNYRHGANYVIRFISLHFYKSVIRINSGN